MTYDVTTRTLDVDEHGLAELTVVFDKAEHCTDGVIFPFKDSRSVIFVATPADIAHRLRELADQLEGA